VSITYPLALPTTPGLKDVQITATNLVGISASIFTGQTQVQEWPGEMWSLSASLPPMKRAQAEAWLSFLIALRGSSGTFLIGDPGAGTPQGVATGTPLVNGANAAGSKTLAVKGWTASIAGILKAGDYLQVGTGVTQRLYKNLTDAASDGSGHTTLDIFPRLRESLADNAPITLINCAGVFRLASNNRQWSMDVARNYGIGFKAVEAI
jgi:hypothetical protein